MLLDISPKISDRLAVFPGDQKFVQKVSHEIGTQGNFRLSSIQTTVHLGAHTDAPNHYKKEGGDICSVDLDVYYGECAVIDVTEVQGRAIQTTDLNGFVPNVPRVLFRTDSFLDPNNWVNTFSWVSAELIHWLSEKGVKLVGIDTPSIDSADSKLLPGHSAIADRDMNILEGIVLAHVPQGRYKLIALPLKIEGADAAPVRAVLETIS